MIAAYLEMIETAPNVYRFVTQPASDAAAPVGNFLEEITALVARPFTTTEHDDPALAAWSAGVVGFVRGIGEWWLAQNHPIQRAVLAEDTANRYCSGATAPRRPRSGEEGT